MKVRDLTGQLVSWSYSGISSKDTRAKSKLHQHAKELLYGLYPTLIILEEVGIPVKPRQTLFLDFYIPLLKKAVEVHGEQHFKYTPHFHGSIPAFAKHRQRDQDKLTWCEINNIEVISLRFDEEGLWATQL